MVEQLGLALTTFALTNVDDLLVLILYFANPTFRTKEIVIGQYLGVLSLVGISLLGLILGKFISEQWIGMLGLLPIFLGIKGLYQLIRKPSGKSEGVEQPVTSSSSVPENAWGRVIAVSAITFANGGDNIGVYTPLFATLPTSSLILFLAVFIILIAVWCGLGYFLVQHRQVAQLLAKYGHIILPLFLILLGTFILIEANTISLLV